VAVEDVEPGIRDGPADRYAARACGQAGDDAPGCAYGGLGGTIAVEEESSWGPPGNDFRRAGLAHRGHFGQCGQLLGRQQAQQRWRQRGRGDGMALQQRNQRWDGEQGLAGRQVEAGPGGKGQERLADRGIEAERCKLEHAVTRTGLQGAG